MPKDLIGILCDLKGTSTPVNVHFGPSCQVRNIKGIKSDQKWRIQLLQRCSFDAAGQKSPAH